MGWWWKVPLNYAMTPKPDWGTTYITLLPIHSVLPGCYPCISACTVWTCRSRGLPALFRRKYSGSLAGPWVKSKVIYRRKQQGEAENLITLTYAVFFPIVAALTHDLLPHSLLQLSPCSLLSSNLQQLGYWTSVAPSARSRLWLGKNNLIRANVPNWVNGAGWTSNDDPDHLVIPVRH